jgi:predicted AAA+ superfamily ATPase
MVTLIRYVQKAISSDLKDKMVFLGGPRQVGKTTFAQGLISNYRDNHPAYLNWDDLDDRERILSKEWPPTQRLIVFDEIHKHRNWRNLIKGYFDKLRNTHQFLVTGSARLDHYRKGGDSLLGRYHYYRMHPLSLPELQGQYEDKTLERLLEFGGFPEPFLKADSIHRDRWHRSRRNRVVYSDIRDLENVKEMSNIEMLIDALPERIGSPLSRKNLAGDLEVAFQSIERWLQILENVYYCYRISPFGPPKIRAVKKEQKLYLWDWSEIKSQGPRWENLVASHLLKFCHFLEDTQGHRMELRFLRDIDGREVDFVVLKNQKPIFAVECKTAETKISPHLDYFAARTTIPKFYQVHRGTKRRSISDRIQLIPFDDFCQTEKLV